MYRPSESGAALPSWTAWLAAGSLMAALLMPQPSPAGVSVPPPSPAEAAASVPFVPPPAPVEAPPLRPAGGNYQIRCWQEGQLLFEENRILLPSDMAQYGVKMTGTDRRNRPIYVTDTKNATCLIRSTVEERRWMK